MKVALFGSKDFDSLEYHTKDALNHLSHQVVHIDIKDFVNMPYIYNYWAIKFFKKYSRYLGRKAAEIIIEEKPDLVICTYRFIHPECVKQIKNALPNTPVVHLNPDQLTTLENQEIFASPYDVYFTKDPFMVKFMKDKMGLNAKHMPEAFNQRLHKPPIGDRLRIEDQTAIDVLTFGTMYPYRSNMVQKLINANVNVSLYGSPDWRFGKTSIDAHFNNEFITGERKSRLLYGAKIVFNNFHYAEVESVNAKFFEINGIGGFQICDYKQSIENYSPIDPQEFTYNNINEAIDLINFYLDKPELRHRIAARQYEHFKAHHTYDIRVQQILEAI